MINNKQTNWQLREKIDVRTVSHSSLVQWGFVNLLLSFGIVLMLLAGQTVILAELAKYYILDIGIWLLVVFSTRRVPLRVPAAIVFMLLLQVWYGLTTLVADVQVVRSYPIVLTYYHVIAMVLCFMQGSVLVYLDSRVRIWFGKVVIAVASLSSLVAIGQLAGIGLFIRFGNNIMSFAEVTAFGGESDTTIRAVGTLPFGHGTSVCLVAVLLIAGQLTRRNLKFYELVLIPILLVGAIAPQVRIMLPGIIVTVAIIIYYVFRRYRSFGVPITLLSAFGLVGVGYLARNRLGYLLKIGEGDVGTFDYRKDYLWTQADRVALDRPWTGIGIEPGYAGMPQAQDNYVGPGTMDSMFHFARATGGYPAIALLVLTVVFSLSGIARELMRKTVDPDRRIFLVAIVPIFVNMPLHAYMGNYFVNALIAFMLPCIVGCAMISEGEYLEYLKDNLRSRYGSPKRFERIAAGYVGSPREIAEPAKPSLD